MAKQTNIRRRGKAWVVSARVNGTQQWKSCRTRDEAELELARMIAQRARGETPASNLRLRRPFERYKSLNPLNMSSSSSVPSSSIILPLFQKCARSSSVIVSYIFAVSSLMPSPHGWCRPSSGGHICVNRSPTSRADSFMPKKPRERDHVHTSRDHPRGKGVSCVMEEVALHAESAFHMSSRTVSGSRAA